MLLTSAKCHKPHTYTHIRAEVFQSGLTRASPSSSIVLSIGGIHGHSTEAKMNHSLYTLSVRTGLIETVSERLAVHRMHAVVNMCACVMRRALSYRADDGSYLFGSKCTRPQINRKTNDGTTRPDKKTGARGTFANNIWDPLNESGFGHHWEYPPRVVTIVICIQDCIYVKL